MRENDAETCTDSPQRSEKVGYLKMNKKKKKYIVVAEGKLKWFDAAEVHFFLPLLRLVIFFLYFMWVRLSVNVKLRRWLRALAQDKVEKGTLMLDNFAVKSDASDILSFILYNTKNTDESYTFTAADLEVCT
jgi:hypothetical protein